MGYKEWLYFVIIVSAVHVSGESGTLLCGRARAVGLSSSGAGSAVALTLVGPTRADSGGAPAPCKLRLAAPSAAAFAVHIIDVEDPFSEFKPALRLDNALRKWGTQSKLEPTVAQDTDSPNKTEPCALSIYIGDARSPIWKINPCQWNPLTSAAFLGSARLLPPRLRISWTPPAGAHYRTDKLRLVVTVVNSGNACRDPHQFECGTTGLCVSSVLVCDDVRHCPGGEDEAPAACAQLDEMPPLMELFRRLAARHQEILGLEPPTVVTKPSTVVDSVADTHNRTKIGIEALAPYGPWGYLVLGMLICATMLMFCALYECCCKRDKPPTEASIPAACLAPGAFAGQSSVAVSSSSALQPAPVPPPAYELLEQPPSYSTLFPRANKTIAVAHSSHDDAPD